MIRVFCVLIGYALGLLQNAFIVGKLVGKIDIREHGSGNAGFTNINRVMGFKVGLVVFVLDVLKAVAAFLICYYIFGNSGLSPRMMGLYGGLGAIIGHNFPFYLGFRGGKGIACLVGILLCYNPLIAVICFTSAVILIIISKYISLASIAMSILLPILSAIFGFGTETVLVSIIICLIALYQHRKNIVDLLTGKESKFSFKKKRQKL